MAELLRYIWGGLILFATTFVILTVISLVTILLGVAKDRWL